MAARYLASALQGDVDVRCATRFSKVPGLQTTGKAYSVLTITAPQKSCGRGHPPTSRQPRPSAPKGLGLGPVSLHIRSRRYINGTCLEAAHQNSSNQTLREKKGARKKNKNKKIQPQWFSRKSLAVRLCGMPWGL